jgi:hypothetical protein
MSHSGTYDTLSTDDASGASTEVPPSNESGISEGQSYSVPPSESQNWNNNTDSSGRQQLLVARHKATIRAMEGIGFCSAMYSEVKFLVHRFTLNGSQTYGRSKLTWDHVNEIEVCIDLDGGSSAWKQTFSGSVKCYLLSGPKHSPIKVRPGSRGIPNQRI